MRFLNHVPRLHIVTNFDQNFHWFFKGKRLVIDKARVSRFLTKQGWACTFKRSRLPNSVWSPIRSFQRKTVGPWQSYLAWLISCQKCLEFVSTNHLDTYQAIIRSGQRYLVSYQNRIKFFIFYMGISRHNPLTSNTRMWFLI